MATRKAKTEAEVKTEEAKTFTQDEVQDMVAKAVADALARVQTIVVQVSTEKPLVK